MREILFRGKVADEPDEWVQGYLRDTDTIFQQTRHKKSKCCEYGMFSVKPDTVGQYTGLTDKNGTKIFEGDILHDDYRDHNYLVTYMTGWGMYILDKINDRDGNWYSFEDFDFDENIEVIGNIHDNPELLEGL